MSNSKLKKEQVVRTIELTEDQKNITPNLRYVKPTNLNRFTASVIDYVITLVVAVALIFAFFSVLNSNTHYRDLIYERTTWQSASQLYQYVPGYEESTTDQKELTGFSVSTVEREKFLGKITLEYDDPARIADGNEMWSALPKNGEAQYSDYRIIQVLAYYYCSFLPGDNLRVNDRTEGQFASYEYVGSADKDYTITDIEGEEVYESDGEKILPKDYYTPQWFNENVLEMTPMHLASVEGYNENDHENLLFEYQRDESGQIDFEKIAVPKAKYFKNAKDIPDPATIEDSEYGDFAYTTMYFWPTAAVTLSDFFEVKYGEALAHFDNSRTLAPIVKEIDLIAHMFIWGIVAGSILIFFVIIPMAIPGGKTIGRLCFRMVTVDRATGFRAKWWQNLLRGIVPLAVIILGFVLPPSLVFVPPIIGAVCMLINILLVLLNRDKKYSLPDLVSFSTLADDKIAKIYRNKDEETQAFLDINSKKALNPAFKVEGK